MKLPCCNVAPFLPLIADLPAADLQLIGSHLPATLKPRDVKFSCYLQVMSRLRPPNFSLHLHTSSHDQNNHTKRPQRLLDGNPTTRIPGHGNRRPRRVGASSRLCVYDKADSKRRLPATGEPSDMTIICCETSSSPAQRFRVHKKVVIPQSKILQLRMTICDEVCLPFGKISSHHLFSYHCRTTTSVNPTSTDSRRQSSRPWFATSTTKHSTSVAHRCRSTA